MNTQRPRPGWDYCVSATEFLILETDKNPLLVTALGDRWAQRLSQDPSSAAHPCADLQMCLAQTHQHQHSILLSINFNLLYTGCPFYLLLILSTSAKNTGLQFEGCGWQEFGIVNSAQKDSHTVTNLEFHHTYKYGIMDWSWLDSVLVNDWRDFRIYRGDL